MAARIRGILTVGVDPIRGLGRRSQGSMENGKETLAKPSNWVLSPAVEHYFRNRHGLPRMSTALRFGPPVVTVDIEDWPQSTWNRDLPITERSVANTHRMLEVLDRVGVRATMFVLGKLA